MTRRLQLNDFINALTGWHLEKWQVPVTPFIDSRNAESGAIFFAFKGENVDGHAYVQDAMDKGAVAAVIDQDVTLDIAVLDVRSGIRPDLATFDLPVLIRVDDVLQAMQKAATWWREELNPRVIGITGSVGKTTTKEMVARILDQSYTVLRSSGSHNNEIGLPMTLLKLTSDVDYLVQEMGMYVPGDIRFLAEIAKPDVGIITNVEPVHAERAGSLEAIALGKRELVEALPEAPVGTAILNNDDTRVRGMEAHTQAQVITYGLSPDADLWADDIQGLGLDGIRLRLNYQDEAIYVKVPLLGRHSAHTVLRGTAAALVEGMDWPDIIKGLNSPAHQLRLVAVKGPDDTLILDDTYNSSPPSALAALNLLADLEGRKVATLGDMLELGAYEEQGHLKVGCRAADVVEDLVVVGPLGETIGRGAKLCGLSDEHVHYAADSIAAVKVVEGVLQPKDVILVKGSRGVKMEVIVNALTQKATR